ncbi:MAG: TPR repeat-containing protein [Candidatus Scalindua rubra]|uniref:TPR repeat-containing protein n=1 Tax=Candidatus Scalindua rubra TaxID=1872076 RepID=A0A1E3X6W5_9BACT|nr:MAG: TPR repeat-containing protein [Candidatus Scalindua rubra]
MKVKIPEYKFKLKTPEFQKTDEEFIIWFLEGVLENYPTYIECLMYLGNAYTAMGMHEKGLKIDLKLVRLKPYDPMIHYNLACSYSLLGRINRSLESLSKAIDLGYNDIRHLENDSDLDKLRNEEGYKTLIDKLKKPTKRLV